MSPRDPVPSNTPDIQATRLLEVLSERYAEGANDPQTRIINALCDLRHLCDQQGLVFAEFDRAGHGLYLDEITKGDM